ncbi:MAG: superoxide dismutase family protein, partial [Pirellulales bacterium]|nr:superoxide dismutase family protein [Pirellulales bacterium]
MPRHVGDLGNIAADGNGVARINITDRMVKLHGPISVNGRSFVVRIC